MEPMNPLNYIQFGLIFFLLIIIALWRERAHEAERKLIAYKWKSISNLHNKKIGDATITIAELSMTVKDLETAKEIVEEDPEGVCAVYQYTHCISWETLYNIEHEVSKGSTERSGYVSNPRLIYTKENGWTV